MYLKWLEKKALITVQLYWGFTFSFEKMEPVLSRLKGKSVRWKSSISIPSIILFSKISEKNEHFPMISAAKLRYLHVSCLSIQEKKRINVARAKMLKKMVGDDNQLTIKSKTDLSKLLPAEGNLKPYIYRVKHRVATYKRASEPIYWTPKPWEENKDG